MRPPALVGVAVAAVAAVAGCGHPPVHTGDGAAHGATVTRYSIDSRFTGGSRAQIAVRPPGAERPPLLVFLHGRGGGPETNVNGEFLSALRALGRRAPAVVFPDGGDHSYWHDRRDGRFGRYVMREVIPEALRRLRADRRRVAIGGISMGGFGAFDLALLNPGRFCAVGGHSAAVWATAGETAPGAFDDAADFARNDVVAMARSRRPAPHLWLDSGDADPFVPGDRALAAALGIRKRTWPGGHEGDYWRSHYDDYMRFYGAALADC
ncbi:MAG TPA: alpha/beta hydrolase-fold protein [Thermoleophilaceae bacterium]|nr:alpha/beta hydrolase-fold protein [Thermoleophilaceae bacterium]